MLTKNTDVHLDDDVHVDGDNDDDDDHHHHDDVGRAKWMPKKWEIDEIVEFSGANVGLRRIALKKLKLRPLTMSK